jgi:hypothetical protein
VSIHYLDYALGVLSVLTRYFLPTDLVSSPFCRGGGGGQCHIIKKFILSNFDTVL